MFKKKTFAVFVCAVERHFFFTEEAYKRIMERKYERESRYAGSF